MFKLSSCLKNNAYNKDFDSERNNSRYYTVSDNMINFFIDKYFTPNDIKLLNIILSNRVSQEDFDSFIESWDIEKEGGQKSLMLSYFMKMHPEFKFPQYTGPRLKGLLQFYRFQNITLISNFKKICSKLKESEIDILIIKGGAIRHMRPDLPRIMGDIDIIIHENDFEKAKKIVEELGYNYQEFPHSIDLHKGDSLEGILDIHHSLNFLAEYNSNITEDIFNRAHKESVFGVDDIFVPCIEDLLYITLANMSKNLIRNTSRGSLLHAIIDSKYFIDTKPDLDWEIIRQNAIKTYTEINMQIAIKLINQIVSNLLPDIFKCADVNFNSLLLYKHIYLPTLRKKSHSVKLTDMFKSWNNFKIKPKYFLCKRKMIRKNTTITRLILKNSELIHENRKS